MDGQQKIKKKDGHSTYRVDLTLDKASCLLS